jgi:hypothetical protein
VEPKATKEKKPRSEAQIAATQKALAAMTAKRKELAVKAKEKKEEVKVAKRVIADKIIKEDLSFATRNEVDSLRKELAELKALHTPKSESNQPAKPERIVERIVERHVPTPITAQATKLTGNALLDRLFFDK